MSETKTVAVPYSGGGQIGIPEAPVDGTQYGRENTGSPSVPAMNWTNSVPISGAIMTGRLYLIADTPNDPLSAVTKTYVDNNSNLDGGTYITADGIF